MVESQRVLDAIEEIGEVAKKLMDPEMQKVYFMILDKIKTKIRASPLDQVQLSHAHDLLDTITRNLRGGKIRTDHIRYFLYFAQSDKLDRLLATWDQQLLKRT
ncbi:Hypothetical predicted protein [Pelobates cultripes]|uniref:Uncharacterized protein n=1 Tax=Pelobates cultripes TaxID=61616 RepID=A0AAD1TG08_PELCU|nr:Hypothetical predicted protein [Pelobates cultripes]